MAVGDASSALTVTFQARLSPQHIRASKSIAWMFHWGGREGLRVPGGLMLVASRASTLHSEMQTIPLPRGHSLS